MQIKRVHHIAIICSDYEFSKEFYTKVLGCKVIREIFRAKRTSYKLDLSFGEHTQLELFSFPKPPPRATQPEARGLRHLAFEVDDLDAAVAHLKAHNISSEPIRTDEWTGKRFTFFKDPDELPLELYEA